MKYGQKTPAPPDLGEFDHVLLYLADADPFPDWEGLEQAEFFNREINDLYIPGWPTNDSFFAG